MTQAFRTRTGGRIDRTQPLRFLFDGVPYQGYAGDTLASALLANGVHLVGRSYKYHRPRGILTAGPEEPNALVGIDRGAGRVTPSLRATEVELYDGLVARSQNRWPSLGLDVGAINGLFAPLFSAGFYYKTFMGPKAWGPTLWRHLFEPVVRQAAGLGDAPDAPDPDRYQQFHDHCDVLIVGAGPAGLAAALSAGASGARVILCDMAAEPGGSLLGETRAEIDGAPAAAWLVRTLATLRSMPNLRLMPRTQAFGYYGQNLIGLSERVTDHLAAPDANLPRERLWSLRAKEVVLACGAIERPLVFADNDRPGIMLADAARSYLTRYGVRPGTRAVIATAHDSAYRAALDLREAGVAVPLIVDCRADPDGPLVDEARRAGLKILPQATIAGTKGRLRISGVGVAAFREGALQPVEWIACDCLLMSGGWTPSVHLHSQSRGKLLFDDRIGAFTPGDSVQRERSAGACRGKFGLAAALGEGAEAGAEAAMRAGFANVRAHRPALVRAPVASGGVTGTLPQPATSGPMAFVDFQNDVLAKDIRLAVREGMRSIEHVKRYTTTGMATDQGKTSNLNALAIAARQLGKSVPEVGLTTFRQPYTPVTFGAFAGASRGKLFDPVRTTPIHGWAESQGAVFEDVGLWKRAHYFPLDGEDMHAAVARECRQVRTSVGLFDASTLGKIEVVGADAARFLDRIYTNPVRRLEPGRCRYGLMLSEAGFVIDDGIVARLAEDRFHLTTTTGGAPRVLHHMEDYLQTEWPDLDVWLTSTTEQWAVIAVQGPRAREVIAPLVQDCDLSPAAMPHMSIREARVCGCPARIMRVSFTGELGYEINVPADYGRAVWEALWRDASRIGGIAYGTEAMHVLRAEKGYIIVGQETDGTVTPDDLGMSWAVGKAKADFVGKRSLSRPDMRRTDRKQLVGLLTQKPDTVLDEGAQITASANPPRGTPALGHVTSSYRSPAAGRSIALALLSGGRARVGETLHVPMPGGTIAVTVTDPVFHDRDGGRIDV